MGEDRTRLIWPMHRNQAQLKGLKICRIPPFFGTKNAKVSPENTEVEVGLPCVLQELQSCINCKQILLVAAQFEVFERQLEVEK
eukprot:scaffold1054_cov124-Cylindrotheca_fusiformis.AAC.4